jgi:signal transduction histidine kinase
LVTPSPCFDASHGWQPDVTGGTHADLIQALGRERALREVTQALARHLSEARVLDLAVQHAANLLSAGYARVWLYDRGKFRCAAAAGFVHARTMQRRLSLDSVSGWAAREGVLTLTDAPSDPAWRVSRDFGERSGLRAYLGAGIRWADESQGVLEVMRSGDSQFTVEDIQLLRSLADAVAVAVANARLYRQANEALALRDRFLAIAAHELRGPLARLNLRAELLSEMLGEATVDLATARNALERIHQGIEGLVRLATDLLDVHQLREGRLPLRLRPTDLSGLVRTAAEDARERFNDHHRFTVELPEQPCIVRLDQDRIEQVLANLLDNAAKYSPRGGTIALRVDLNARGATVSVRDEGIGFLSDAAEFLFEPFGRAENARTLPGAGLGLYICRHILTQHKGRIWAESAGEGQGASVHMWLPQRSGRASKPGL